MSRLAERTREERRVFIQEAAARLGTLPVIVEKDYWVCWLLGKIFTDPRWEHHLVFKGGTSLSKVFHAINRFSEDIVPAVKLEFGSLTDQRPVGWHTITPMLAGVLPGLEEERDKVVAMEVERTFWEKATILHSEYHRPAGQAIGERFSRHYSDVAALWQQPAGAASMGRLDLLKRVAQFKARFFGPSWANYGEAKPGSLRLVPPPHREAELRQDYAIMESMFLVRPPAFEEVVATLREAEAHINALHSED